MAEAVLDTPRLILDEYFALERESEERPEYLDGEVFEIYAGVVEAEVASSS